MNRQSGGVAKEFVGSLFGDWRRGERFRAMLGELGKRTAGKVSKVFRRPADQQAAYDFLENESIKAADVQAVMTMATARRCSEHEFVYVVVDGSSVSLTDEGMAKGFGSIGTRGQGGRGLKMMNALALTPNGQTLGPIGQVFWVRGPRRKKGYRRLADRESVRWHEASECAVAALKEHAPETRTHVLADREADATRYIQRLLKLGCDFTIRANGTRKVLSSGRRVLVTRHLKQAKALGKLTVELREKEGSPARTATLSVRAAKVEMVLRDHHGHHRTIKPLTVVWGLEENAPRGVEPINWMLYTTTPAKSAGDAIAALRRYAYRWRIEDFHKMLKSGGGNIEESQLRSVEAVVKWATMHAIVAGRAQRLRDAARTTPDAPVTTELTEAEIEALVVLKTREKRRNETVTAQDLTLARAVRWIGDLGGFTATGASLKMPGSTVIERGLERVIEAAQVIEALRASGKMR